MERDNLIDEKVKELQTKAEKLKKQVDAYANDPFRTNLKINNVSLRVIGDDVNTLIKAFEPIATQINTRRCFKNVIDNTDTLDDNFELDGYTVFEWIHDFNILFNKATINSKLAKINLAISQLQEFYSDEKLANDKFDKLLASLNNIL